MGAALCPAGKTAREVLCSNDRTWISKPSAAAHVPLHRMITAEVPADKPWLLQCGTSALAWEPHGHRMVIAEAGSDSQVRSSPPGTGLPVEGLLQCNTQDMF